MAEPKTVVEEFFRRQLAGDDRVLDDLVAENMVNHAAGPQGRDGLRQILDNIRHDFGDGRSRYEEVPESHHDHLIDVATGSVIEFRNEDIEKLQRRVAEELGFELIDHRLELYGVPLAKKKPSSRRG